MNQRPSDFNYIAQDGLRTIRFLNPPMMSDNRHTRWYRDYPKDHVIDEEWCQRAAQVVTELNGNKELETLKQGSDERVKELFKEDALKPSIPTELNKVAEPEKIGLFNSTNALIVKQGRYVFPILRCRII